MIEFFIAGTPVPKARARVVRQGGKIRSYTPSKTADYEMYVKWMTAHDFAASTGELVSEEKTIRNQWRDSSYIEARHKQHRQGN
jgi:hypothetical protein